jgi:hypothetical protein
MVTVGIVLTLAFGLVAGNRAHFLLWVHVPKLGARLPGDAGALLGLALAAAYLAA